MTPLFSSVSVSVTASSTTTVTPPTFGTVPSDLSVVENLGNNQTITTVTAQASNGGRISYIIAGGNIGEAFGIDASTGRIFVKNVIDYELMSEYRLWVEAAQSGNIPAFSYKEVVVRVEDLNDNKPMFTETIYEVEINENSPFGTPLTTVTARDADTGVNGEVTYRLDGVDAASFRISPTSGRISVFSDLDREVLDLYGFTVIATDKVCVP